MSRDLVLIAIALFTWGLGEGLFLYFQPVYLQQLGADPIEIGSILGGFGLATAFSHLPAGYLADRLGRKGLMIAAWALGMVSTWIMALASGLPVFVIGFLLYGTTLFVLSPLNSYVTAARGRLSVGRAITLVSAFYNLGAVLGPWIGGQVGDRMGLRQTYYLAGWIFIVSTLVILFIRPQPVERVTYNKENSRWLNNPRYHVYLAVIFLATFAMYLPQPLSPNFLENVRGLNLRQIGQLYSISSIGVVTLNLRLGQLPARIGFLLGQAAVGAFALILWQGSGLPAYTIGFFLLGGFRTARSLGVAQVRELVPPEKMGIAYGLTETVGAAAVVLTAPLAGFLFTMNPFWMYTLGAGLIFLSLLISMRFSPVSKDTPVPAPGQIS
ncbi:MAG TPA: MFS transporter [Anaerolineales bacterium]